MSASLNYLKIGKEILSTIDGNNHQTISFSENEYVHAGRLYIKLKGNDDQENRNTATTIANTILNKKTSTTINTKKKIKAISLFKFNKTVKFSKKIDSLDPEIANEEQIDKFQIKNDFRFLFDAIFQSTLSKHMLLNGLSKSECNRVKHFFNGFIKQFGYMIDEIVEENSNKNKKEIFQIIVKQSKKFKFKNFNEFEQDTTRMNPIISKLIYEIQNKIIEKFNEYKFN